MNAIPLPILALLLVAVMLAAHLAGFKLRARRIARTGDPGGSDENYLVSGVFGLLALLMAFAFSLAIGRFEDRRHLALLEANAIDTMASRIELVEQPKRAELIGLLGTFARARAEAGRVQDDASWQANAGKADAAGTAFRDALIASVRTQPESAHSILLVEAMNTMLDTATARHAARGARLPGEVLLLLAFYCIAGAAMLGYALARSGHRHLTASALLFAALAAAFATIIDLDRPRGGAIVVQQQDLEQVAQRIGAPG